MEKFLHPMFLFDALFPFAAGIAFCLWQLWELKKENRKAALQQAARQQAAQQQAAQPQGLRQAAPVALPALPVRSVAQSDATTTLPATIDMTAHTDVRKLAWDDMAVEELTPLIGRRLVYTETQMLAHVYLKQGAIVPAHDHMNEQITYILSGALRFWIGEHADNPGDTFTDVRAGEVLVIPSHVRHRAEALEDTLDVDIFNPPRQDWIDKSDSYLRTGEPMSGSR